MNPNYQIMYWRDIPAQVKVRSGRERITRLLATRFQEAIDEAAMRARTTSEDAYLEEWRATDWQGGEGDPESLADRLVTELEKAYPPERLETLTENKGFDPSSES